MSAAPVPKPEPPPGEPADADGWALLDSLRRKLDDQSAQTRKAAAQVGQLAESIAALVEMQRRRARWLNLNAFGAYLVFTVLLGGAFYFVYQSRANELVRRTDEAVRRADDAVRTMRRRADDASARVVAREAADGKALEAWQLLEAGKRDEAQKRIGELASAPLSRLEHEALAAKVKQTETATRGDGTLDKAAAAFKAGRFGDVVAVLDPALAAEPTGKRAAEMHYFAGLARARMGEVDQAIPHFEAALAGGVSEDDARFQLASALDRAGQWVRAKSEYEAFAAARPQSPFAAFALRRIATLAHPAPAQPAPTPAIAPAAPAAPNGSAADSPAAAP